MDIDNMSEDELSKLRGDFVGDPETETEAETGAETETETSAEAETEDETGAEAETEDETGADTETAAEDETETAAEDETETAAETETETEPKNLMIPKRRYDSVKGRLTQAEQEAETLRQKLEALEKGAEGEETPASKQNTAMQELIEKHAQAVADGDTAAAAIAMSKFAELQQNSFNEQLAAATKQTTAQTKEELRYEAMLDVLEDQHPEVNPDSDKFDEDLTADLVELRDAYELKGYSASAALKKATSLLLSEPATAPDAKSAPAAKPATARKTDVARNVDAAKRQPPAVKAGIDSDKAGQGKGINVMDLSYEAFEELTEEQLSKMRGDFA